jgi:hypothetical protein
MKRAAWLLLAVVTACNENIAHVQPPMDRFFFPGGLALTPVAGGNQALLVASANFDLHYDRDVGATILSVDPSVYDEVNGVGGSAGRPGGALVKLGPGAQVGSYTGPLALVDGSPCGLDPGLVAYTASRYTGKLYRVPVGADGSVGPCQGTDCVLGLEQALSDPAALGVACRPDSLRSSLFVSYLRAPALGTYNTGTAWLSEFDLRDLGKPPRTFAMTDGPVGDMAYDALTDRLYAVGRFAGLFSPLFILDLPACSLTNPLDQNACPNPRVRTVDLYGSLPGAELVGIALSNPQPGRLRSAYLSVRIYDVGYASAIGGRPGFDVGGAIMVVDLEEDLLGQPSARVRSVVPIGIGAGTVRVLPVRPGLGDLVVVPSTGDGTIQVYDDEVGAVVRVVSLDSTTGAPLAGHLPSATAVEDRGTEALVYIASFQDWTVSALRVPLADPTSADLLRHPAGTPLAGTPLRIGSPKP